MGALSSEQIDQYVDERRWADLRQSLLEAHPADAAEILSCLVPENRGIAFRLLPRAFAYQLFSYLPVEQQEQLVESLSHQRARGLLREMSPDDRAHLLDELPAEVTRRLMYSLSPEDRADTQLLLAYPEDSAGRYMTPEYVSIPMGTTAAGALDHVRRTARATETANVIYVLDDEGRLVNEVELARLVLADPDTPVSSLEEKQVVSVMAMSDREEVVKLFEKYDRIAIPVTDKQGHMLGIITVDDVLDFAEAEATEDMHRIGGLEPIEAPYTQVGILELLRKRAGWLAVLFLGEMLTATAMGHFEEEIARAVVLALFVPLIISSGGNSGSQAASLIIRAVALRELRLGDWFRVFRREFVSGLGLGAVLGGIGFVRIYAWQHLGLAHYGEHYVLVALTVALSLLGVVLFGTLSGSMLPFVLKRLGLDPATSSAPFVATLVDVTGLIIYFSIAHMVLSGTLL